MKMVSKNMGETRQIAEQFLVNLGPGPMVVALEGDLGSGKTTFTQEVGKILGVGENMHSPTFVIMKIYEIDWRGYKNFIHIDAYRLEEERELLKLGWAEIVKAPENLVFIEWPERVPGLIPASAKRIKFQFIDEETREVEYENF